MFDYYYLAQAMRFIDKVPREVSIGVAAYFIVNEIHKRHCQVKIKEIEEQAKVHAIELEVDKLRLQIQLREMGGA